MAKTTLTVVVNGRTFKRTTHRKYGHAIIIHSPATPNYPAGTWASWSMTNRSAEVIARRCRRRGWIAATVPVGSDVVIPDLEGKMS